MAQQLRASAENHAADRPRAPGVDADLPGGTSLEQIAVHAEAVQAALRRILASRGFAGSERLRRFLAFIVEHTLHGEADKIKEYALAVDVFERPEAYDPRVDALVRVEARRLREKLARYYQEEGRGDPIRIVLPKGSYVPLFQIQPKTAWYQSWRLTIVSAAAASLVLTSGAVRVGIWPTVSSAARRTVVVLPFANLSSDAQAEFFASGLVEELNAALSRLPGLRVLARSSAARLAQLAPDRDALIRQLRVGTFVTGSVRAEQERIRVTTELVDATDGSQVWAASYDSGWRDAIDTQERIAGSIVTAVQKHLGLAPSDAPRRHTTHSPEARAAFIKGRYERARMTPDGIRASLPLFEQAVALDPRYALAHAALADVHAVMAFQQMVSKGEAIERAKAAARKALELDEALPESHGALGWIQLTYDWDWESAERELRRALALDPNLARVHQQLAFGLASRRRFGEAIDESMTAMDLDPLSFAASNDLGVILYFARQYDAGLERARQVLDTNGTYTPAHVVAGLCLLANGRADEAVTELRLGVDDWAPFTLVLGRLGAALVAAGWSDEASELLRRLQNQPSTERRFLEEAYILTALGNTTGALASLEEAVSRREGDVPFLAVEPLFDRLRTEPDFQRLLRRAGLR